MFKIHCMKTERTNKQTGLKGMTLCDCCNHAHSPWLVLGRLQRKHGILKGKATYTKGENKSSLNLIVR